MARRAYSDLLKPARLASTAMLRAKSFGMRSENVVNDSIAKIVLPPVCLSSVTNSNTKTRAHSSIKYQQLIDYKKKTQGNLRSTARVLETDIQKNRHEPEFSCLNFM
jgi:hypothetical protein